MITRELNDAIIKSCQLNHDESVINVLTILLDYSNESGVNLLDVKEQISCMIAEIGDYIPEPNDLRRVNSLCKQLTSVKLDVKLKK